MISIKTIKTVPITVVFCFTIVFFPLHVDAKTWFHATRKAWVKNLAQKGFLPSRMSSGARFGKGGYISESRKLAMKERPNATAVVPFRDTKLMKNNTIDLRKLSKQELKAFSKDKDLRGNIHYGVPGGDLAKKLGREAGNQGKVIVYPSARGKGANAFIPKRMLEEHRRIISHAGKRP